MRRRSQAAVIALLPLLAVAAYRSLRVALASHDYLSGSPETVHRATLLEPGRALYRVGWAQLLEDGGEDPRDELRQAVALAPDDANIRIRLALQAEFAGDNREAERQLLSATRVSRKYEPRWSLANYYFRRQARAPFWHWAKEALKISYGDPKPLFALCSEFAPDPETILARAIPNRRPVRLDFVSFLSEKSQWTLAGRLLESLAGNAEPAEAGRILAMADRLLRAGEADSALSVWNSLVRRGLIPYGEIHRDGGQTITNADFSAPLAGLAFGWRTARSPGVYSSPEPGGGLRVELDGDQPEHCEILSQFVPVIPGRGYTMSAAYGGKPSPLGASPAASGLRWRVDATGNHGRHLAVSTPLAATGKHQSVTAFEVPPWSSLIRLSLAYEHEPGTARFEGAVTIRRIAFLPGDSALGRR